jgi:hypothetical protein
MIAAMIPEDRFSGIALAKFGSFAEVVHGPDLALGKSTDLVITRSRKAAVEPIGEGFKPPNDLTLPISSKPDPRLTWSGYSRGKPRETSFKPHGMAGRGRPPALRKPS